MVIPVIGVGIPRAKLRIFAGTTSPAPTPRAPPDQVPTHRGEEDKGPPSPPPASQHVSTWCPPEAVGPHLPLPPTRPPPRGGKRAGPPHQSRDGQAVTLATARSARALFDPPHHHHFGHTRTTTGLAPPPGSGLECSPRLLFLCCAVCVCYSSGLESETGSSSSSSSSSSGWSTTPPLLPSFRPRRCCSWESAPEKCMCSPELLFWTMVVDTGCCCCCCWKSATLIAVGNCAPAKFTSWGADWMAQNCVGWLPAPAAPAGCGTIHTAVACGIMRLPPATAGLPVAGTAKTGTRPWGAPVAVMGARPLGTEIAAPPLPCRRGGDAPATARVGCSLRRRLAEDSSPSTTAEDAGPEDDDDWVGMRSTPSTVVAIAGTVPVPVAAMIAGSDCCSNHRMVSPSDLCPSSRVSWKILAAHAAGMRIRLPRPSTLVCRSRFLGGGLRTMAIPPKNSTGSGLGTSQLFMGMALIATAAAPPPPPPPAAPTGPACACCCRVPSSSPSSALSCACASMGMDEKRLDWFGLGGRRDETEKPGLVSASPLFSRVAGKGGGRAWASVAGEREQGIRRDGVGGGRGGAPDWPSWIQRGMWGPPT
ncbi:hypothetical protein DAI22_08g236750 [Oryza sativa Japonica Group]|nr:hypothetical protein DAI22_08g236750 [Oryza sativa Japonica Group]